jgi:hypothetical protein
MAKKGGSPSAPDYDEAARQGVYADLETYPLRYLVEAASKQGGKVTIDGNEYDFTGAGEADNAAVMSDKMAQTLLDLQRDLGPDIIKQRIEELKLADPQGYAARKDLFDRIIKDTESNPDRPLADDLQRSIVGELANAGKLDSRELQQVQQAVRGSQVRNNNFLGNAATAEEAGAVVKAGESLRDQQQQQALGFLESGVTPEDVQYRRIQQQLANLGAFISGETPEAQFKQLSGAGNGAVPFVGGTPNTQTTNPNAGQQGVNNALDIYTGKVNWAQNQVNPWIAGISTGVTGLGTAINLGWQPGGAARQPTNTGSWYNFSGQG